MNPYDVIILGGGLAGNTLAIQLKKNNPALSILILEKRNEARPVATHKVGESTVELGTHYLRNVLDLKDYLDANELPKYGLRFFLTPTHKGAIEKRVEYGPRQALPVKSHQLDRGTFETYLEEHARELGTEILTGNTVKDVTLAKGDHRVKVQNGQESRELSAKWVVDATGRAKFLQRKLGLHQTLEHNINAAWFRLKGDIDIDDWSADEQWRSQIAPGVRRLSTIHLMDKGYWVWIIPLATHNTSFGIVADPRIHPFESFNKLDKAFAWLAENEPKAHEMLAPKKEDVLDFKVLKNYAHHCRQVYSGDGWAITGEAGPFLDPLYSPGTDFIAINNTLITDLILRDMRGEDIDFQKDVYQKTYLSVVDNWLSIYQDKYPLMGYTQTMVAKITWDWAYYWSFLALLFVNDGFTNLRVIKELFSSEKSMGRQLNRLNQQVQELFIAFSQYDHAEFTETSVDPIDLTSVKRFYDDLDHRCETGELIKKLSENCVTLEKYAAELYRRFSSVAHGTRPDIDVDPYTMDLTQNCNFAEDGAANEHILPFDEQIANEVDEMWLYSAKPETTGAKE